MRAIAKIGVYSSQGRSSIRYKVDKAKLPEGINEEMFDCAGKIAEIDRQMQDMYRRIKAAENAK